MNLSKFPCEQPLDHWCQTLRVAVANYEDSKVSVTLKSVKNRCELVASKTHT